MPEDSNSTSPYRAYLPDLTTERFTRMKQQDCYEYAQAFKESKNPPWLHGLYQHWMTLLAESFKGVTSDGMRCTLQVFVGKADMMQGS
jgi:hypothetical protein